MIFSFYLDHLNFILNLYYFKLIYAHSKYLSLLFKIYHNQSFGFQFFILNILSKETFFHYKFLLLLIIIIIIIIIKNIFYSFKVIYQNFGFQKLFYQFQLITLKLFFYLYGYFSNCYLIVTKNYLFSLNYNLYHFVNYLKKKNIFKDINLYYFKQFFDFINFKLRSIKYFDHLCYYS